MSEVVLVVVAHADDEALGCGGTMAKYALEGSKVHVVFLTNGVSARLESSQTDVDFRHQASKKAAQVLGVNTVTQLNFPDNATDTIPILDIIKKIEMIGEKLKPTIVLTHHKHDLNIDHQQCHKAVLTAFRPMPSKEVHTILAFEVASSTEWNFDSRNMFAPNVYFDISSTYAKKIKALEIYSKEMRPFPHARSIDAIQAKACVNGTTIGVKQAEAFQLVWSIK
jgi:N-acetylglucosamine malate deacetylase 1